MQVSNVFLSNSPPNTSPLTSVISLAPTLPNYIFFNPPSSISAASEWPYPHAYTGSIKEILK